MKCERRRRKKREECYREYHYMLIGKCKCYFAQYCRFVLFLSSRDFYYSSSEKTYMSLIRRIVVVPAAIFFLSVFFFFISLSLISHEYSFIPGCWPAWPKIYRKHYIPGIVFLIVFRTRLYAIRTGSTTNKYMNIYMCVCACVDMYVCISH